ncbi:MAG: fluoride efflux transporter CrcB [Bryobacteraceae bacterium]
MIYVWIAVAGGAGSLCRYLVWRAFSQPDSTFPAGTLTVNLAGCFCIGLLSRVVTHDVLRLALITGFLGGFTTFSAFGMETLNLFRHGLIPSAVLYLTASNVGGLAAAWAGWRVGDMTV